MYMRGPFSSSLCDLPAPSCDLPLAQHACVHVRMRVRSHMLVRAPGMRCRTRRVPRPAVHMPLLCRERARVCRTGASKCRRMPVGVVGWGPAVAGLTGPAGRHGLHACLPGHAYARACMRAFVRACVRCACGTSCWHSSVSVDSIHVLWADRRFCGMTRQLFGGLAMPRRCLHRHIDTQVHRHTGTQVHRYTDTGERSRAGGQGDKRAG